jgi:hypothetical protein
MTVSRHYLTSSGTNPLTTLSSGPIGPWTGSVVVPIQVAPTVAGGSSNSFKVGNGGTSTNEKIRVWGWVTEPHPVDRAVSRVRVVARCEHWLTGTKALAMRVLDIDGTVPNNSQLYGNTVIGYATSGTTTANGYKLYTIDVELVTPVAVAAGRRLFLELGADLLAGGAGQGLYIEAGETGADLPFTHGLAASNPMGRGWFEVEYADIDAPPVETRRLYMPSNSSGVNTPAVTPAAPAGPWQAGAFGTWSRMAEIPTDTAFASRTLQETQAGSAYTGGYGFVSDELPEGALLSKIRVCMQASSGSGTNPTFLAAHIRTLKASDLSTVATLYSGYEGVSSAGAFTFVTREIRVPVDVLVGAGEHLVVETGLYCVNSVSTSMGGALKVGDPTTGTDAAVGDTGEKRAWVEYEYSFPDSGFPGYVGSTEVSKLYLGATEVSAAFLGSTEL